jgi:hypothetical protein
MLIATPTQRHGIQCLKDRAMLPVAPPEDFKELALGSSCESQIPD